MAPTVQYKEAFRNRWNGILPQFGLDLKLLNGKHGPCPFCGGKDRFRYTDYRGRGDWICNQCGSGDGFEFVQRALGVDFREAVKRIESVAKDIPVAKPLLKSGEPNRRNLNSIWSAAEMATIGCPVGVYLGRRLGYLRAISGQLRYHRRLAYLHDDGTKTFHPAMIAIVSDADGNPVNLHRTYLTPDGHKADVPSPKKICAGSLPQGSAIRLTPPAHGWLGIAEGIETALAVTELTGALCWAAVNCHGLETWEVPESVWRVTIFGDNDSHYVGQGAAYALAKRLSRDPRLSVDVKIPREHGDWCDVLSGMREENKNAA